MFSSQDSTSSADLQATPLRVQALVAESTLLLKEPLEAQAGPLQAFRKRLQVDLEARLLTCLSAKFKQFPFFICRLSSENCRKLMWKLWILRQNVQQISCRSSSWPSLKYSRLLHTSRLVEAPRLTADPIPTLPFLRCSQVLQTLNQAEQVCAELLLGVSGLDWRLAELHLWETEARDVYHRLKTTERQRRGQDPRARVRSSAPRRPPGNLGGS